MHFFMTILTLFYVGLVYAVTKSIAGQIHRQAKESVAQAVENNQQLKAEYESLVSLRKQAEAEAGSIFTLYDLTKEITKTFNEEEAFQIFQAKLRENIDFEKCVLLERSSTEIKDYKADSGYTIFYLKHKRRFLGYLVVKGVQEKDMEKLSILGHQFALVLRRIHLYREIERLATTDSLTEVHTRRYILERLEEELGRSQARQIQLSFLMIDIDHFKTINDEYGHLTGDQVLREISRLIQENIREIDVAGRYGGEEFCVCLPDTDRAGAQFVAERIRSAVAASTIQAYDKSVKATLSIGLSVFPQDGQTSVELIDKADQALYLAKKAGRNAIHDADASPK